MPAVPGWKCINGKCRHMQTHHRESDTEPGVFYCEDGRVGRFKRFVTKPTRRTWSGSGDAVRLLHVILSGVMNGKDLRVVLRNPLFPGLVAKIAKMRAKSKAAREAKND